MNGEKSILLQELCLLINVIICFGIPLIGMIILRKKYNRVLKPFLVGMLTFSISQLLIRIPIVTLVLPKFSWYLVLQMNPYLFGIFLGLTAGIFEETSRLIFIKLLMKDRTRLVDGLAFGLGHGGIEAMIIVGLSYIATMIMYPLGYLDMSDATYLTLLTGGFERIFAVTFHIGASLLVLYGVKEGKSGRYTLLAILLHGLLDSMLVILPAAIGLGIVGLEIYVMVVSILVLLFALHLFNRKSKVKPLII